MQSLLRRQLACSSKSSPQSTAVGPTRSRHQRTSTVTYAIERDIASSAALQDSLTTAQDITTAAEVNISQPTPQIAAGPSAQTSKCPLFSSQAASGDPKDAQAVKEALRDLPHGPGWAVIQPTDIDGEDFSMPLPEGRFCWNPLLGEVTEVVSKGMGPFMLERYRDFGPVFSWQMGQMKVISVLDYETIKSIMQYDGRVVKAWGSESMYAILGDIARVQFDNPDERVVARRMQAPGFTAQAIAQYIPKIVSITSSQLDEWATAGSFDLANDTKDLSFEFSTQLLVNFAVPKEQKAMLREKFDRMFTAMSAVAIKVPGSEYMRGIEARAEVIEDIKALLAIKRQQEQQQQGETGSEQHKASVLDTMLEAFKYLMHLETPSDDDIASTGVTLIIAGNDTSGLGIMGMLGLLALKPEVMQKLREEQEKVLASHGESIDRHALEAMPYADAVAREALRITPPAPQLFRRTLVPMQIAGRFIPAGSILSLGNYIAQLLTDPGLHKHHTSSSSNGSCGSSSGMASYLDQIPEHNLGTLSGRTLQKEFNPDRWLAKPSSSSSSSSSGKPSGLLTFGTGRHECLGRGLFMNEAKVLLALLARSYELELERPEDFSFRMGFSVEPPKDCVVKVHKRK